MRTLANQGLIPVHQHQHQHVQQPPMAAGVGDFRVVDTAEGPVLVPVAMQPGLGQNPAPAPSLFKTLLVSALLIGGGVYVYRKYVKKSGFLGLADDDPAYEPRHRAKRSRSRVLAEVDRLLDSVEEERRSGRRALPAVDDAEDDE